MVNQIDSVKTSGDHNQTNPPQLMPVNSELTPAPIAQSRDTDKLRDTGSKSVNYPALAGGQPGKRPQPDTHYWLLQTVLPTALTPLLLSSAVNYVIAQQHTETSGKRQLTGQLLLASEGISNQLVKATSVPETIAISPATLGAARAGGEQSKADKLDQLTTAQINAQFQSTKRLQLNQALNDYLKNAATVTNISELSMIDRYGITIAASKANAKVVQRNQPWWQQVKQARTVIEPEVDTATNTVTIGISQAIVDPATNEFLGAVRAVVPVSDAHLTDYLQHADIKGTPQIQLLSSDSQRVITTVTGQDASNTQTVVGGQPVEAVVAALGKAVKSPLSSDQVAALKDQYHLQELAVTPLNADGAQVLTAMLAQNGKQYAFATIPATNWVAVVAIESAATGAGLQFLWPFALTFLVLAAAATVAVLFFTRRLSTPLRYLAGAAAQVDADDLNVVVLPHGPREIQILSQTLNSLSARIQGFLQEQTNAVEQSRLLSKIASTRTHHEQDVEKVFNRALDDARQTLAVDRMVIYRFNPDWSGFISHEAVAVNFPRALNDKIEDPCIPSSLLEAYQHDRVVPTSDVFNAGFHPDHMKLMERLRIKANLVVPILHENQLFGLLIAHHCATTHEWQATEIAFMRQLAAQLGVTLDRVAFAQERENRTERSQLMRDITLQLTQADTSESVLAQLPLIHIRQLLKVDRVLLYRFDAEWKGTITAESVSSPWPRALGAQIYDPCFAKDFVEKYKRGRIQATANIEDAGLTRCHLDQLEPFAVKANLVAPVLQGDRLLGLLIAHHCAAPHEWTQVEVDLFAQVANQIALALDRCNLLEEKEVAAARASELAAEQQQQKETLQRQLANLLSQVEAAASGNLTVRAEVTTGEIGTVADFFNSIIENLRQIVTQVKQSALRVSSAIGADEDAIHQLTHIALKQAEETTRTLNSIEQMTQSIQVVAANAHRAAAVASTASSTAAASGMAMDLTVQNILGLREMIGDTAKKMKRLGESSQQISKVVSLIEKIALQTNLLSINAGIEAARAGQEGQGFSVVAEEIGELAAKSAVATGEIEAIVNAIQMETAQVIAAMEQSTTKVVEGTRLVEDAKQSLNQILEVSQQIDQLVMAISEATVSQTQTSEIVTNLIKDVVQTSQQTSDSSSKIANSLQRTVSVAQELQASVETFKVETDSFV